MRFFSRLFSYFLIPALVFGWVALWYDATKPLLPHGGRYSYVQAGYIPTNASPLDRERAILYMFQQHVQWVLGVEISYKDLPPGSFGYSILATRGITGEPLVRQIVIDDTWNPASKFENLAHEAAHFLAPPALSIVESEVFVEAVVIKVCQRWGMDCSEQSERYTSIYKQAYHIRYDYREEIEWAALVLSGR